MISCLLGVVSLGETCRNFSNPGTKKRVALSCCVRFARSDQQKETGTLKECLSLFGDPMIS